jgi:hypothetical protein
VFTPLHAHWLGNAQLGVPQFAPLHPALHAQLSGGVHRPVVAEAERNAQKNSTAQSVRQAIRRMVLSSAGMAGLVMISRAAKSYAPPRADV